jgi:hypothetical protein
VADSPCPSILSCPAECPSRHRLPNKNLPNLNKNQATPINTSTDHLSTTIGLTKIIMIGKTETSKGSTRGKTTFEMTTDTKAEMIEKILSISRIYQKPIIPMISL